ncbi:sunset domain-containing protein [Actinosynnema pretiosum]
MWLFGQVWLWSLLAFLAGVLLTWFVLVRPVKREVAELERKLRAATSVDRAASRTQVASPARDEFDDWHSPLADEEERFDATPTRREDRASLLDLGSGRDARDEDGAAGHDAPGHDAPGHDAAERDADEREQDERGFDPFERAGDRGDIGDRLGGSPTGTAMMPKPVPPSDEERDKPVLTRLDVPRPVPARDEDEPRAEKLPAEETHVLAPVRLPADHQPPAPHRSDAFDPDAQDEEGNPEITTRAERRAANEETTLIPAKELADAIAEVDSPRDLHDEDRWPETDQTGEYPAVRGGDLGGEFGGELGGEAPRGGDLAAGPTVYHSPVDADEREDHDDRFAGDGFDAERTEVRAPVAADDLDDARTEVRPLEADPEHALPGRAQRPLRDPEADRIAFEESLAAQARQDAADDRADRVGAPTETLAPVAGHDLDERGFADDLDHHDDRGFEGRGLDGPDLDDRDLGGHGLDRHDLDGRGLDRHDLDRHELDERGAHADDRSRGELVADADDRRYEDDYEPVDLPKRDRGASDRGMFGHSEPVADERDLFEMTDPSSQGVDLFARPEEPEDEPEAPKSELEAFWASRTPPLEDDRPAPTPAPAPAHVEPEPESDLGLVSRHSLPDPESEAEPDLEPVSRHSLPDPEPEPEAAPLPVRPARPKTPAAAEEKPKPKRSLFEPLAEEEVLESEPVTPATPAPKAPAAAKAYDDQPFVPTLSPELLAAEQTAAELAADASRKQAASGLPQRPVKSQSSFPKPQQPLIPPVKSTSPPPARPMRPRPVGFSPTTGGGGQETASSRYQQPEGFNPRSPFGPGSVLPKSDGKAPAPEFVVKATLTGRRYFTDTSANFRETRADVWFRTTSDAEKAGFHKAP